MNPNGVYDVIKACLWGEGKAYIDRDVYKELVNHSITLLTAPVSSLECSPEIRSELKKDIFNNIAYYCRYKFEQANLQITVPYVILKGTSAAKYYPHPEYRTMGDIDIFTRREDFDQAYHDLEENGYVVFKTLEREVSFGKNGIVVELHRYFASLNDAEQARYMDDLIIENIDESHVLPDEINGLVLLEHINQHLERGLGLRQIIDWMMFVDQCLPDDKWPDFRCYAKAIGLEALAIAVTRMCEMYLGLSERQWSSKADKKTCAQLMDYIMMCGNFGNQIAENTSVGENVIYYSNTPTAFFSLLQERGLANWKAAQKHAFLRPFAGIYQLFRYSVKSIGRDGSIEHLKTEYSHAQNRNRMFKKLGVKQVSKGLSVYRDGKYTKKKERFYRRNT